MCHEPAKHRGTPGELPTAGLDTPYHLAEDVDSHDNPCRNLIVSLYRLGYTIELIPSLCRDRRGMSTSKPRGLSARVGRWGE